MGKKLISYTLKFPPLKDGWGDVFIIASIIFYVALVGVFGK